MTITIDPKDWQKVLAEVVGTFFFFFIGIGSISTLVLAQNQVGALGIFFIAVAHGFALAVAISALGHISGAHFNPAVTIGLLTARKIGPVLALLYILAQLLGGVMSCLALVAILPQSVWDNPGYHLGNPSVNTNVINITQAIILEAILTFFLVLAVFGTAVDPRANRIAGFGIGFTVFVDIMVGGPLTGGVMNPARAFAPALVTGNWGSDWYVYWVGPILGSIVAALLYSFLFLPKEEEPVVMVPAISDHLVEPPLSQPAMVHDLSAQEIVEVKPEGEDMGQGPGVGGQ